ncbi:MAG: helix-turn-helix domain-containing protein [Candidatus Marinimicrobia bacterium]|nr:helix-turn-helix domain-containing protein [Candidatus Neomarinimicrobiota bacterium]
MKSTPWLTITEASIRARCSVSSINRMIRSGMLKCYRPKIGKRLIHRRDMDAAILGFPKKRTQRQHQILLDMENADRVKGDNCG